jgi:hypothetical protein
VRRSSFGVTYDPGMPRTLRRTPRAGITVADVRAIAAALPGVEEGPFFASSAFRLGKKFLVRVHEDGVSLVVKVRPDVRDMLMSGEPGTFYITDHYRGYPEYVLACMATVPRDIVAELMEAEWRRVAPKRAVAAFDQALGASGSKATRRRRSGAR